MMSLWPHMIKKMTEDSQHFSKEEEQTIYSYVFFKNFYKNQKY